MVDVSARVLDRLNRRFTTSDWISVLEKGDEEQILNASLTAGSVVLSQFYGFNDLRGKRVLDLGCGSAGKSLCYSISGAAEVVGVDVDVSASPPALREARRRGLDLRVLEVADGAPLPFAEGSFDIVIASSVLEHIRDVDGALKEVRRVLRTGGQFLNRWHPFHTRFGSHLHHVIGIPFAHVIFRESALMRYYHAELLRRHGRIPASLARVTEQGVLNDVMYMNRITIDQAAQAFARAGFVDLATRYFRGTREIGWVRRLPAALRATVADYEVNVLRKA